MPRDRAYRRHKLFAKWITSIRKWMPNGIEYFYEDGEMKQYHPTYRDCMKDKNYKGLKYTRKACSCSMCRSGKYNRIEFKKDTKFHLKNAS